MGSERPETFVVAVVGSPRRGNSSFLADAALEPLRRQGFACEKINVTEYEIGPCKGHDECGEFLACLQEDDAPTILEKVFAADGLILASPVYFENVSAQLKALMDRSCWHYERGSRLRARAAGLVAVAESSGLRDTLDAMRRYLDLLGGVPAVFEASGYADRIGDAREDARLLAAVGRMADQLAASLRP